MSDLEDRLSFVHRIATPDLWPEVLRRAEAPEGTSPPPAWPRLATVAVAAAIAVAGVAFAISAFRGSGSVPAAGGTSSSPSASASSNDACAFPTLRPSTLPWIPPGDVVPPPEEVRHYKRLNWFGPQGTEWEGAYVSLRLLATQDVTSGDPAPPLPDGTKGYEVANDGEWDMFYAESPTHCGAIAMYVNLPRLSQTQARSVAEDIVTSLTPAT
jgi:hypothetical protein